MQSRDLLPAHSDPTIRLLGPMAVERHGKAIGYTARKGLALLACLCLRPDHFAPRDTLIGLLWADAGEDQARASLRQTLSGLRKALGDTVLLSDGAGIALAQTGLSTDLAQFQALSHSADLTALTQAVALYRGDLLEGFAPVTPEFDRWLDAERSTLRAQVMVVMLRLSDAREAAGEIDMAIAAAHRVIAMDPLQEQVHRRVMRLYLKQKRHDAALKQFDTLKSALAADLGVGPDAESLALIKDIRRQRSALPLDTAQAPPRAVNLTTDQQTGRPAIAVLPFKSVNATDEAALFGEAVSEEIIVELARDSALLVVSRGSSFQFSLTDTDATEIGRRLGVRFLLGGTARIAGSMVRVTAHLVQCDTGREIWAERHDRALKDIFAIQTDIARTVTATVVGRIAEAEAAATLHRPFESLESYSLMAQGYRRFQSYSAESYAAATVCLQRAVALDPGFARAWGLLALLGIYQRWYFEMRTDVQEFVPLAEKALQLDPRDAKAKCALALCHLLTRQFDRAGLLYEEGLQANPNDELLLIEYGRYLMYVERPADGLIRVAEAMRINPLHPNWYWNIQGRCLHMLGRTQEALEAFQRIHAPTFWVHSYLAACHAALGQDDLARAARAQLLHLRADFDLADYMRVMPYKTEATARRFIAEMGLGL